MGHRRATCYRETCETLGGSDEKVSEFRSGRSYPAVLGFDGKYRRRHRVFRQDHHPRDDSFVAVACQQSQLSHQNGGRETEANGWQNRKGHHQDRQADGESGVSTDWCPQGQLGR